MKKAIVSIIISVILIIGIVSIGTYCIKKLNTVAYDDPVVTETNNIEMTPLSAVVVNVKDNYLAVMGAKDNSLYTVSYSKDNNIKFKQGQEILIYFDGMIAESYPAQILNVSKVDIVKEKSDIEIPENVIKQLCNSLNNVSVSLTQLTKTKISFILTDTNELPYSYSSGYQINKKNEGIKYVKESENKVIPATNNSTSSYVRYGYSNMGRGFE